MSSPCTNNSSCKNVETVETEQKTFKLITLNVLAQCHYDWQHKHKYGYINISENDEMRDFQFRFDRICDYLINFDADIYTLQEVEIEAFNKNYKPFFDSIGYDGVFQETKNSYHVATATFWRRNLLRLEWSEFRSRSMILCLIPISNVSKDESDTVAVDCGKPLYLINVHLEGNKPDKYTGATRLNQIASTFKKLSSKLKESGEAFENIALIFVGDMNAMPEEETHQLLQNGTLPADFTVSLPGDVFCKPEEPLNIVVTKKQIDLPGKLRNVFADAQPQFTFVGNSHAFVLDAVYVTQHVRVLERIDPSQRVDDVSQFYGRLPCLDLVPSDHLPLGITFQLHTNTNTTC